jgi:F plasmid transfer operon, TraF, protein
MSFKPLKITATAALLLSSSVAIAIPFGSFDTRSMAMGGAGVAVGGADAAPLFNPALLSVTNEKDKFSIILPTIGVRISDPDKLRDSIDNFDSGNYINNLQTAINQLNTDINNSNAGAITTDSQNVGTNLNKVNAQLATLSNKPITAEAGLATVVAMPSKKLGAAFYATGTVTAGGLFSYTDGSILSALAVDAGNCTSANPASTACTNLKNFNTNTLTSGIHFKGVQLSEIGFALSHEFQISEHSVSFGITPKIIKAKLFDTVVLVKDSNQSNNISLSDNLAEYTYANFDLGVAKNYDNGWRTGFVIRNVIPQTLDFKKAATPGATPVATGETLKLMPQARIGVSHANSWSTVALDVDLTRNDPAGFESNTQYIALGGELNAWDWAQLRAGYRVDMVNSARSVASVGLGLAPFGVVHVDLAVAGNANEIGASFQLGVHF